MSIKILKLFSAFQVRRRLDYQTETTNVLRRTEQRHMVDWIINNVRLVCQTKIVICFCSTVLPFNHKIVYPAVLTSSLVRCLVCILSEVEVSC